MFDRLSAESWETADEANFNGHINTNSCSKYH